MHLNTGLRIVRIHSPFRSRGSYTLAPFFDSAPRQLAPLSRCSQRAPSTAPRAKETPKSAPEIISSERLTSPLPASSTLNPPASTRPPPLELPTRDPSSSLFTYLFRLGKAYTTFYKAGLYAIIVNRRVLSQSSSSSPSSSVSVSTFPTRADVLLRARVWHDLSRLPIFGLLVLVFGEFTPLIVLVFPRLTPYTCRIPKQSEALRRSSESRRAASFRALQYQLQHADTHAQKPIRADMGNGHICRSLGLTSVVWDKLGLDGPFAATLAGRAIQRIAVDDTMIRSGGGAGALVDDEIVLACEDRGMDVRGEPVDRLRARLEDWLRKTAPEGPLSKESDVVAKESARKETEDKIRGLLLGLDSKV
ncbi:hypothetical protein F4677DRAFT_341566 [Hypoxylon crocopeplum]|nr:hypothetical protein F4677DRAFT_341566 [Hypoxylon crocopeplum]